MLFLPPSSSDDFPAALRAAREKRGMTSPEFAKALGISPGMVPRYENPKRADAVRPNAKTYLKMLQVLGMEQGGPAMPSESQDSKLSSVVEALANALEQVPDAQRAQVEQHMTTLVRAPDSQRARDALTASLRVSA